jgi:uncharacterized protein (DUF1778 family)
MAGKVKKKAIKLRGARRMRQVGYKKVEVWMDDQEYALLKAAANEKRMPLSSYMRSVAAEAAKADNGKQP